MNDRERIPKTDSGYMLMAIRRAKENTLPEKVVRRVSRNFNEDVEALEELCRTMEGKWRIYRSVNRRDFRKALKEFKHRLIDDEEEYFYRVDSLWKKCLMQPKCRAEKKFLIDVDTKDPDTFNKVLNFIKDNKIFLDESSYTPNGSHFVVEPFDVRLLNIENVELIKDGMFFIEEVD